MFRPTDAEGDRPRQRRLDMDGKHPYVDNNCAAENALLRCGWVVLGFAADGRTLKDLLDMLRRDVLGWLVLLTLALLIAAYVIVKIRLATLHQERMANELMSKFREMHSRGELSDTEFRTIKTTLKPRLHQELSDTDKAS